MRPEILRAAFGLNEYESKVLSILMYKGELKVGQITKLSGVPRSRVYDIAEGLVRKGLAKEIKERAPIVFISCDKKTMLKNYEVFILKRAKDKIKSCKEIIR